MSLKNDDKKLKNIDLLDEVNRLRKENLLYREKYIETNKKLLDSYKKEEIFLNMILKDLKNVENEKQDKILIRENKIEFLNIILNQYIKEENLLKSYMNLQKQHYIISKKYKALTESKLGKITLKYWKLKKYKGANKDE